MSSKFIAKFKPTEDQHKWVVEQAKETGESQASVMRGLIQQQVNKDKRKK